MINIFFIVLIANEKIYYIFLNYTLVVFIVIFKNLLIWIYLKGSKYFKGSVLLPDDTVMDTYLHKSIRIKLF